MSEDGEATSQNSSNVRDFTLFRNAQETTDDNPLEALEIEEDLGERVSTLAEVVRHLAQAMLDGERLATAYLAAVIAGAEEHCAAAHLSLERVRRRIDELKGRA